MKPRFIADVNVGKLAKWLRILGYDTLFIDPVDDKELLQCARREQRILLTRDQALLTRRVVRQGLVQALLVRSDSWQEQLHQVVQELRLPLSGGLFSRCVRCNVPLVPEGRGTVRERVPPYVYATQDSFKSCPQCGRTYWKGTHWARAREGLDAIQSQR